jgi:hypothetical protein
MSPTPRYIVVALWSITGAALCSCGGDKETAAVAGSGGETASPNGSESIAAAGGSQTAGAGGVSAGGSRASEGGSQTANAGAVSAGGSGGKAGTAGKTGGTAGAKGSAGGSSGTSGSGGAAGAAGSTQPVTVKDYEARGPYTVKRLLNQGMGTIQGGTAAQYPAGTTEDPSAFTLYFPENSSAGEKFPLLTFGNGTYVNPTYYDELIGHVVSHGFVVIGANDSMTGSGQQMLTAIEWATAQAADKSSPIFGKVDVEYIGAFGQSQGGVETCMAGMDPRVDAIAPLSGVPFDTTNAANLKASAFFVNSYYEANNGGMGMNVETFYNSVTVPAIYGVLASGNHNSYGDIADDPGYGDELGGKADDGRGSRAAVTAWFDWQLKGKKEVRALFVGANCGFCSGSTWQTIKSKGF